MSAESGVSQKASMIYEYFHPGDDPIQFDRADQYIISLAKGDREIGLRVAQSKDGGRVTGVDHTNEIVVTISAPNSARVMYINGGKSSVWLNRLKSVTDEVFKDPRNFEIDND